MMNDKHGMEPALASSDPEGHRQAITDHQDDVQRVFEAVMSEPLLYILRRLGEKDVEYSHVLWDEGEPFISWTTQKNFAHLFDSIEAAENAKAIHGGEIVPVKLVEMLK